MQQKSTNTVWHHATVTRDSREQLNEHKSVILWFTGLSGAGKSTLANAVEALLYESGKHTYVLDGDNVRQGLCGDLSFSEQDRVENIRRIGEVAKLFVDAGMLTLSAFISPFKADRLAVRNLVATDSFIEIYCRCDLSVCEERDVKGLYKKARAGEIAEFTGISSPYEEPEHAELVVDTDKKPLQECAQQVVDYLMEKGII